MARVVPGTHTRPHKRAHHGKSGTRYLQARPGVIVMITTVQVIVIVIDGTECNVTVIVIVIKSKVIVIELLLCYYN